MDLFCDDVVFLGESSVSQEKKTSLFRSLNCFSCRGVDMGLCPEDCFLYSLYVVDDVSSSCFECQDFLGRLLARFYYSDSVSRSLAVQLVNAFGSSESLYDVLTSESAAL